MTIQDEKKMNMALIRNRYSAPKKNWDWCVARPYPAVHNGGMSDVAIATPGNTFPLFLQAMLMMPAAPPKSATITS